MKFYIVDTKTGEVYCEIKPTDKISSLIESLKKGGFSPKIIFKENKDVH
jgi:hypothetical protein